MLLLFAFSLQLSYFMHLAKLQIETNFVKILQPNHDGVTHGGLPTKHTFLIANMPTFPDETGVLTSINFNLHIPHTFGPGPMTVRLTGKFMWIKNEKLIPSK